MLFILGLGLTLICETRGYDVTKLYSSKNPEKKKHHDFHISSTTDNIFYV